LQTQPVFACDAPSIMRSYLIHLSKDDKATDSFLEAAMRETATREIAKHAREVPAPLLSRRDFARMAALLTAGSALPFYNEAALAQDLRAIGSIPADVIRLHTNENPLGPCPAALEAIRRLLPRGGQYAFDQTTAFVEAMAADVRLPTSHIMPTAGSSDPLHRAVLACTSPSRPLVLADPGYEAPARAAHFLGAKVISVRLRRDYAHDARAMAQADRAAGVIYICNPNNPTGSVTRREDVDYIVANKPRGCIVLVDEAYIHFSTSAASAIEHVAAGRDVIVLRSFSKLYGMAGLRAGAALARPDLLERLRGYGGLGFLPMSGTAGATASLKERTLVAQRRQIVAEVRNDLAAWLDQRGFAYIPSEANMIMIDCRRPGREVYTAMLRHNIAIGRSWPSLPTHVRVTIGTRDEMARFKDAFAKVMGA
jgi:histidinol-phosphate aminotransferase